jgi:glycosyltransferase involved in cell wall biosynthesis
MRKASLAIIIPAFKKEKTIAKDLKRIEEALKKLHFKVEIICIVDGMADKTFEKALDYVGRRRKIRVLGYSKNQGKGFAIRLGIAESKADLIAFIDSGGEIDPLGLKMAYEHFKLYKADIIVGSKRHTVSEVEYPWQRRVLSFGYQLLIKALFELNISDTQVGLKIFKREVLEKVLPRCLIKGYAFDIEILAVAYYLGYKRIFESPISIKYDFKGFSGITSNFFIKTVSGMLFDTLSVYYRLYYTNYYADSNPKWRLKRKH